MTPINDKIRGCLIGGAAGDALGYPVEFHTYETITKKYGKQGIREYVLENQKAIISDDTQMSLFTAGGMLSAVTHAYRKDSEKPLSEYLYLSYLDWLGTQGFQTEKSQGCSWLVDLEELYAERAPGNTCLGALASGAKGSIEKPLNQSYGCGGVMRAAPISFYSDDIEEVFHEACQAAAVTHGHPLGYLPAGALAYMIHRIVYGDGCSGASLKEITAGCCQFIRGRYKDSRDAGYLCMLLEKAVELSENRRADAQNISRIGEGWVGEEALAIAVYAAVKYEHDFDQAIVCAVNHSGDSDSTGAVAGNLVGAAVGYGGIGNRWKRNLELHTRILEVADDIYLYTLGNEKIYENEDWVLKYIHGRKPEEGVRVNEFPGLFHFSVNEYQRLMEAADAESKEEFKQYICHYQTLSPINQARAGWLLAGLDSECRKRHNYDWSLLSGQMISPFRFCGFAGSKSDIGPCYQIHSDCFAGRDAQLVYIDDGTINWGQGYREKYIMKLAEKIEAESSGLSGCHPCIVTLGKPSFWLKYSLSGCCESMEEAREIRVGAIVFHLDSSAVKEEVIVNGKSVSSSESGGYMFVLPQCGEFNMCLMECFQGECRNLQFDMFCMK